MKDKILMSSNQKVTSPTSAFFVIFCKKYQVKNNCDETCLHSNKLPVSLINNRMKLNTWTQLWPPMPLYFQILAIVFPAEGFGWGPALCLYMYFLTPDPFWWVSSAPCPFWWDFVNLRSGPTIFLLAVLICGYFPLSKQITICQMKRDSKKKDFYNVASRNFSSKMLF